MHIFDYVKCRALGGLDNDPLVRRDLRSLSAVCRFFCATTAPWLFQFVSFDGLYPANQPGMSNFCRKLLAGDRAARLMAQYVTKCELFRWEPVSDDDWTHTEFMAMYTEALIHMPNIEELRLTETGITKGLLRSMTLLPKLSRLDLAQCFLTEDVTTKHLKKLSSLKLQFLSFEGGTPDDIVQYFNLDTILHLKVVSWHFSSHSLTNHGLLPLETFDCLLPHAKEPADMEAFFSRTPALKFLRFATFDISYLPAFQGNRQLLQRLQHVEGTEPFVNCISPGRPVESAVLLGHGHWNTDGPQRAIRRISRLSLHGDVYAQLPLWQHFPDLEFLEIRLDFFSETAVRYISRFHCSAKTPV